MDQKRDRAPVCFDNKETGIAYDGLQLLMLHFFVQREAVFNTCEMVLCIFNCNFYGM